VCQGEDIAISVAVCDVDVEFELDVYGDDAFCDFQQIVELDKMHLRKQITEVSKSVRVQTTPPSPLMRPCHHAFSASLSGYHNHP
jgi:hypothetical protein